MMFTTGSLLYFILFVASLAACTLQIHEGNRSRILNDTVDDGVITPVRDTKLICYFKLSNEIDPALLGNLCTHINVAFFEINPKNSTLDVPREKLQILKRVLLLKNKINGLKVVIAVGGANAVGFSNMVKTHLTRKKFIKSSLVFMKQYGVDGIDLDWEWPALNGNANERIKFIQLLYEFNQVFMKQKKTFILSVDVSFSRVISELAYNIHYMAEYVTYVNVMCYDYHYYSKWYPFTGHNAPLYSPPSDLAHININNSIYYWLLNSMPREKIVLGVPTYGHTYRLYTSKKVGLHAPSTGVGSIGNYGFICYKKICQFAKGENVTVVWDDVSKVPYAYHYPEWISYDNEQSLSHKAVYVQRMQLAGVMVYSVNDDDFSGDCHPNGRPLPLIRTLHSILFNEV